MARRTTATNQTGNNQDNTPQEPETVDKGPSIDISAPRPYRRAGMKFGKQPVTVSLNDLSKKQVEILKADPVLVIRETPKAETKE